MIEDVPSRTAYRVALRRAAHQVLDPPVIFDDPLALKIAGAGNGEQFQTEASEQTTFARFMRAFMSARSRLAEDQLGVAVASGVTQYVVLGAGLDTFGCRNPFADLVTVFEVDFPATQDWKRRQLRDADIAEPPSLRFVPVDFERQDAFEQLTMAGLDPARPVFFAWLGVTMYLEEDTVWSVFRSIAALAPGSGVVFDYAMPRELLGERGRAAFEALARRVELTGEPFRASLDPRTLTAQLRDAGFSAVEQFSSDEINRRYFDGRADGLRVSGLMRMATATV